MAGKKNYRMILNDQFQGSNMLIISLSLSLSLSKYIYIYI